MGNLDWLIFFYISPLLILSYFILNKAGKKNNKCTMTLTEMSGVIFTCVKVYDPAFNKMSIPSSVCSCTDIQMLKLSSACCSVCCVHITWREHTSLALSSCSAPWCARQLFVTSAWLTTLLSHSDSIAAIGWESVRLPDPFRLETKQQRSRSPGLFQRLLLPSQVKTCCPIRASILKCFTLFWV